MTSLSSSKLVSTSEWIKSSWLPPTTKHKSRVSRKETVFPALKRSDESAAKCHWPRKFAEPTTQLRVSSQRVKPGGRSDIFSSASENRHSQLYLLTCSSLPRRIAVSRAASCPATNYLQPLNLSSIQASMLLMAIPTI